MQFAYEAISAEGRSVIDRIDAESQNHALDSLRHRGFTVTSLALATTPETPVGRRWLDFRAINARDIVVFTRQMKMLLDSGATLVQALEAIEKQAPKRSVERMVGQMRELIERGGALADAIARQSAVFSPVYRSMIAAGEATATLSEAFSRLADTAERQQKVQRAVVGALIYPAILCFMCINVVIVLITFVVPRFRDLFLNLHAPLPLSTQLMFIASEFTLTYWPFALGGVLALVGGLFYALRRADVRRRLDEGLMRVPFIGRIISRLMVARVLRVWSAMLACHVPLLDTIRLAQTAISSSLLLELLKRLEDSVAGGGRVGRTLAHTRVVEPVVASAITIGEENGRLPEAIAFVSNWIDDENQQLVTAATRVIEPLLLAVMGAIVGLVAMSLFIPLFDMATAAGG